MASSPQFLQMPGVGLDPILHYVSFSHGGKCSRTYLLPSIAGGQSCSHSQSPLAHMVWFSRIGCTGAASWAHPRLLPDASLSGQLRSAAEQAKGRDSLGKCVPKCYQGRGGEGEKAASKLYFSLLRMEQGISAFRSFRQMGKGEIKPLLKQG